ncbi:MAG: hypothetical protein Q4P71_01250 [Actinomycetaceae bacterium]|nr:hypothetical protein [Actinomycetaceae bacterium]
MAESVPGTLNDDTPTNELDRFNAQRRPLRPPRPKPPTDKPPFDSDARPGDNYRLPDWPIVIPAPEPVIDVHRVRCALSIEVQNIPEAGDYTLLIIDDGRTLHREDFEVTPDHDTYDLRYFITQRIDDRNNDGLHILVGNLETNTLTAMDHFSIPNVRSVSESCALPNGLYDDPDLANGPLPSLRVVQHGCTITAVPENLPPYYDMYNIVFSDDGQELTSTMFEGPDRPKALPYTITQAFDQTTPGIEITLFSFHQGTIDTVPLDFEKALISLVEQRVSLFLT